MKYRDLFYTSYQDKHHHLESEWLTGTKFDFNTKCKAKMSGKTIGLSNYDRSSLAMSNDADKIDMNNLKNSKQCCGKGFGQVQFLSSDDRQCCQEAGKVFNVNLHSCCNGQVKSFGAC